MRCPDCDYELPERTRECPRCEFRRSAAPSAPQDVPALADAQAAAPRTGSGRWAAALLAGGLLVGALWAGTSLLRRPQTPEVRVRALFAAAEGPCRRGEASTCQESLKAIRTLDDQPDASLLLADLKVADYLHTLPGGDRLSARWQQDQITQPELTAMGNVTYRKGLHVYRSLWISADIKRDGVAVPELVFGGAKFPDTPN